VSGNSNLIKKEERKMNKTTYIFVLVLFLSLGLLGSNSYAAARAGRSGFMMVNSSNLIGAPVKDSHGEFMGIVNEVMVDSGGHAFAVVNHGDYDLTGPGGINTPVPFQELRISQTKGGQETVILKTDMEHLDFAPYLDPLKMENRQYEANIYEYYGIQPYWTQSGTAGKSKLMELNSLNLIGASVKDSHGELMGIVNEVMVDSGGHAFAVINHGDYDLYGEGGVNTPVPFQELRISHAKGGQYTVVLKTDMEHLDFAPYLDPLKTNNRQYEASIYEYYGIQPYWTRSGELSK
jgi:sporulation protein YlmC with PRC-barrel domain